VHHGVDDAFHATCDHYGPRIVGTLVGPDAARATLRLDAA
jgi:hypothetical protein